MRKVTSAPAFCQRADGIGCNRPQNKRGKPTAFSSAVPNHRRPGAVIRRNGVDCFCIRSGWNRGIHFVSPRLFSSQEESSRFLFYPFLKFINDQKWRKFIMIQITLKDGSVKELAAPQSIADFA